MIKKEFLPGWAFMFGLSLLATAVSKIVVVGGKSPIEASLLAIILGMVLRNVNLVPKICFSGIKKFEQILIWGIVFIGASLNFHKVFSQGWEILTIVLVTMVLGFTLIYFLAKIFRLSQKLSALLAIGTTICGGTAIAVMAPLIESKEEETSYAIGTVALWGLLAILIYPQIAFLLEVSDFHFGVFAGTAIHSTPQVVGAGFIFSDAAGQTATAVKLVRNCFMVPLAFGMAIFFAKRNATTKEQGLKSVAKAFPWFLFGYFIMAGLGTYGVFSSDGLMMLTKVGKFLILMGLAGIGLNTDFRAFRSVGYSPLWVGLFGSLIVAASAIFLIRYFL